MLRLQKASTLFARRSVAFAMLIAGSHLPGHSLRRITPGLQVPCCTASCNPCGNNELHWLIETASLRGIRGLLGHPLLQTVLCKKLVELGQGGPAAAKTQSHGCLKALVQTSLDPAITSCKLQPCDMRYTVQHCGSFAMGCIRQL